MSCEIYEVWDELCSELFAISPAYQGVLAKPASGRAVSAVERNLQLLLPPAYAEFLRMHNGTGAELFIAFELYGVTAVRAATHARRIEARADGTRAFLEGGWDENKVVIGDSQIGWKLVLDCESGGVFAYEQNNCAVQLADSFTSYLSGLRDNLRHEHYQVIDGVVFMEGWGEKW